MRAYVDFLYYRDQFFGQTIPEEEFWWLSRRASLELDRMCMGRIVEETVAVKDACCAVAEVLFQVAASGDAENRRVFRERASDIDFAYAQPEVFGVRKRMLDAATLYLWPTRLLSR